MWRESYSPPKKGLKCRRHKCGTESGICLALLGFTLAVTHMSSVSPGVWCITGISLCGRTSDLWDHFSKVLELFHKCHQFAAAGWPMRQSSCPGTENTHPGSILSIITQSCLGRKTDNNCLQVHVQHTSASAYVKYFYHSNATPKNPHWTHSALQTSPAHLSWEPWTLPRGNHAVAAVSFPSDCCLCSLLQDQVSGEFFSLSLHVHSRTPGLAPASCKLEKKSHRPAAHGESDTRGCFGLGSHISQNNKK